MKIFVANQLKRNEKTRQSSDEIIFQTILNQSILRSYLNSLSHFNEVMNIKRKFLSKDLNKLNLDDLIEDLKPVSEYLVQKFSIKTSNDLVKALESQSMILALKIEENHNQILDDIYENIEVQKIGKSFKTFLISSSKRMITRFMINGMNYWTLKNEENERKIVNWSHGIELLGRGGFEINYVCLVSVEQCKVSCFDSVYEAVKSNLVLDKKGEKEKKKEKMESFKVQGNVSQVGVVVRKKKYWSCGNCGFPNYSIGDCELCEKALG